MNSVGVRSYRQGDEHALAGLLNQEQNAYSGVVYRSPAYWVWASLLRPGVGGDGILIATRGGLAVGYLTIDDTGTIWDAAFGPTPGRGDVVECLINAAVARASIRGAERMAVNVPEKDRELREALERHGFRARGAPVQMVGIPHQSKLLQAVLRAAPNLPKAAREVVRVELSGSHPWNDTTLDIDMRNRTVYPDSHLDPTITLRSRSRDFNRFVLGHGRAIGQILTGTIEVVPKRKILVAWRVLASLRHCGTWFHPLGDIL